MVFAQRSHDDIEFRVPSGGQLPTCSTTEVLDEDTLPRQQGRKLCPPVITCTVIFLSQRVAVSGGPQTCGPIYRQPCMSPKYQVVGGQTGSSMEGVVIGLDKCW
uniref:Uncharacterized protein n=1 Tax=Knipowitschia caucasica TaxID=637954 RepID=A0AAV2LT57_KNICA